MSFITRRSVKQILALFDMSFRKGVIDACNIEDDNQCRNFLSRYGDGLEYSILTVDYTMTWREWTFIVRSWCREFHLPALASQYLDKVYRKNFQAALYQIVFEYYLDGIREWLDYPNPHAMELFMQQRRIHWKKMPRGQQKMTLDDQVANVQELCFKLSHCQEKCQFGQMAYETFGTEVWMHTRKIPKIDGDK